MTQCCMAGLAVHTTRRLAAAVNHHLVSFQAPPT